MQIDIDRLDTLIARGIVQQGSWGDGHERACLMSAVVSDAKSEDDCAAQGWPLWLAEMVVWLFDNYPADQAITRGRALMSVIKAADEAGRDWDDAHRRVRSAWAAWPAWPATRDRIEAALIAACTAHNQQRATPSLT